MSQGCSHRRLVALVVSLALGLSGASLARAATGDAELAAAIQKFDEGRKAYDNAQYDDALRAFKESYALAPSPNSRLYIARSFKALGKTASAYTAFRMASREAQDRLTATQEKRYGATRDAASAEATDLESKVARLTIVVPADLPAGYTVKENGDDLPKAAWGVAIETDPGKVTIEATGPRLVPFKKEITLTNGTQERVEVIVKRVPTATLALALKTRPSGLAIAVDGRAIDASEAEKPREVDVGDHSVTVEAPGYTPFRWKKSLADGQNANIDVELETRALGTPKWLFFTVAGAAVAAEGVAAVLAVTAKSSDDTEQAKSVFLRSRSAQDSIHSRATTANVFFISGGVLALGALGLVFTTHWHSESDGTTGTLSLSPLGAHGSF